MTSTELQEQALLTGAFLIIATITFISPSSPAGSTLRYGGVLEYILLMFFVVMNVIGVFAISARHKNTKTNTLLKKILCKHLSTYKHKKLTIPASTTIITLSVWLAFIMVGYTTAIAILSLIFGIVYIITNAILTDPTNFMEWMQTSIQTIPPELPLYIIITSCGTILILFILTTDRVTSIIESISGYITQKLEITCDYTFPETVIHIFDEIESLPEPDKIAFKKGIDSVLEGKQCLK